MILENIQEKIMLGILIVLFGAFLASVVNLIKRPNRDFMFYSLFIIANFIIEIYAHYLSEQQISNLFLIRIYNINVLIWLTGFYYWVYIQYIDKLFQIGFGLIISALFIPAILFNFETFYGFSIKFFIQVFFLFLSIRFLFYLFDKDLDTRKGKIYNLFNASVLVHNAGSIFTSLFRNQIMAQSEYAQRLIFVNVSVVNLISYIMIFLGSYHLFKFLNASTIKFENN